MGFIRLQTPPGLRKSGMPDSVEMPAPVNTTMRRASAISRARSLRDMPHLGAITRPRAIARGGEEADPAWGGDARVLAGPTRDPSPGEGRRITGDNRRLVRRVPL